MYIILYIIIIDNIYNKLVEYITENKGDIEDSNMKREIANNSVLFEEYIIPYVFPYCDIQFHLLINICFENPNRKYTVIRSIFFPVDSIQFRMLFGIDYNYTIRLYSSKLSVDDLNVIKKFMKNSKSFKILSLNNIQLTDEETKNIINLCKENKISLEML